MIAFTQGVASPDLLRLQAVEKELAGRFFAWADAQGLTAFLVCGSALGAVRHGDMIPWDDDIDIGMLRADFERLFANFSESPIAGAQLQSHRNEARYPYPFAKLRLDGTTVVEAAFVDNAGHNGIFIDIFPFDALPKSKLLRRLQQIALGLLNLFIMPPSTQVLSATRSPLVRLFKKAAGALQPRLPLQRLIAWREWWTRLPGAAKGEVLDSFGMYGIRFGPNTRIAADLLVPPVPARFGGIDCWLPRASEQYLTTLFGDFLRLPPEDQQRPGHVVAADFGGSAGPSESDMG